MNERNDYRKVDYGDYRTVEQDGVLVDQEDGARIFVNRVYNWMFCGLMLTAVAAWCVSPSVLGEQAFKAVLGLSLPLMIVELVLVIVLSAAVRTRLGEVSSALQ